MTSGIYAIANFGTIKLYVGEVQQMKTRWPKMMAQLDQGIFPDTDIQREWKACEGERRFTFHIAEQIKADPQIRGRKLFLKDMRNS